MDTKIQDALAAVGVFYLKVDTYLWYLKRGLNYDHKEGLQSGQFFYLLMTGSTDSPDTIWFSWIWWGGM